jgi:hypothetical protein
VDPKQPRIDDGDGRTERAGLPIRPARASPPDPLELLRLMSPWSDEPASSLESETDRLLLQRILTPQHSPAQGLSIEERARYALSKACNGWRRNRICRDASGRPLETPHPGCLRAQIEHDTLLGESGISD